MDDDIVFRTMHLIKNKYSVDENTAMKYSKMALESLESHGGTSADFLSIIKVVDVVVKSWMEDDGHI
jgi:hypothetical protein